MGGQPGQGHSPSRERKTAGIITSPIHGHIGASGVLLSLRKDPSKASAHPLPADPSQETFQPLKEEGGPCCVGKEGPVERSPQGHLLTVRPRLRLLVCV